ncbi:MAG: ribonuclease protein component [Pseudonocardiales bacterium]|jgi:ribonuclease P protein component|nr:ribonuclease protein component [Pseudonocardiales bacterium]
MRRSADFTETVRAGRRAGRRTLVVHLRTRSTDVAGSGHTAPIVGLVVGRSVGGSVVRHQVSRRLRAQLAPRLHRLPVGSATVVRALPPAATATSAQFGADLDAALDRLTGRR